MTVAVIVAVVAAGLAGAALAASLVVLGKVKSHQRLLDREIERGKGAFETVAEQESARLAEELQAIHSRWQAGDRASAPGQVSEAMVDELVLAGSTDHIRERLEAYSESGLGTAALAVAGAGRPALERLLEELAS